MHQYTKMLVFTFFRWWDNRWLLFSFFVFLFLFSFLKNTYVVYVTYELEKNSQAIYIFKTQFFKKLGSNLDLLFSKADYCHLFSNIFSVVNNLWCMCVRRTERSSKGLTLFYLQRKGQMIKKNWGVLFYATDKKWGFSQVFLRKVPI